MKVPKVVKRYCPYCGKHREQRVVLVSTGRSRGALKRGSKERARKRGAARGMGSHGKWGRPPISRWKRKTKTTKKTNFLYRCTVCGKGTVQKKGIRVSKITFKEK